MMADRLAAALFLAAFGLGMLPGYVWGRRNGSRALDRAWDDGYQAGTDDCTPVRPHTQEVMPDDPAQSANPLVTAPHLAAPVDWREQTAAELAPEALAAEVPQPGSGNSPASDVRGLPGNGGVRLGAVSYEDPGLGHAPIGWVDRALYENAITRARIEAFEHAEMEAFHADVAAVDAQIVRWAEWARESLTPAWSRFDQMVRAA